MVSVRAYYSGLNLQNQDFYLQPTSHKVVLKLIEEINPTKAAGIDKIRSRFLKYGATVWLAQSKMCAILR